MFLAALLNQTQTSSTNHRLSAGTRAAIDFELRIFRWLIWRTLPIAALAEERSGVEPLGKTR
jgi:hypothetical protein